MHKGLFFLLFLSFVIAVSCQENRNNSAYETLQNEVKAKQTKREALATQTVNLSFKGIVLAAPFKQTMQASQKSGQIKKLKYSPDKSSATCQAEILLPNREAPLVVDVKVTSYQDTINSILILSDVYETYPALLRLYSDKYEEDCASIDNKEDYWGDKVERSCSSSLLWTFKNQTLRTTTFYSEKRENYVKNPQMKSPENRYGVKYTKIFQAVSILYSDIAQCAKAEAADKAEQLKKQASENEQNRKQQETEAAKQAQHREQVRNQDI